MSPSKAPRPLHSSRARRDASSASTASSLACSPPRTSASAPIWPASRASCSTACKLAALGRPCGAAAAARRELVDALACAEFGEAASGAPADGAPPPAREDRAGARVAAPAAAFASALRPLPVAPSAPGARGSLEARDLKSPSPSAAGEPCFRDGAGSGEAEREGLGAEAVLDASAPSPYPPASASPDASASAPSALVAALAAPPPRRPARRSCPPFLRRTRPRGASACRAPRRAGARPWRPRRRRTAAASRGSSRRGSRRARCAARASPPRRGGRPGRRRAESRRRAVRSA